MEAINVAVGIIKGEADLITDEEEEALVKMLSEVAGVPVVVSEYDTISLGELNLQLSEDLEDDLTGNIQKIAATFGDYYVVVMGSNTPAHIREAAPAATPYLRKTSTWSGVVEKCLDKDGKLVRWAITM